MSRLQYLLYIVQLPLGFLDRAAGPSIFPLEEANNRIVVVSNQRQAFLNWRVARSQLNVRAVVSLSVFDMNVCDTVVALSKESDGVVVAGRVMTNVEIDDEQLGHAEQFFQAFS